MMPKSYLQDPLACHLTQRSFPSQWQAPTAEQKSIFVCLCLVGWRMAFFRLYYLVWVCSVIPDKVPLRGTKAFTLHPYMKTELSQPWRSERIKVT